MTKDEIILIKELIKEAVGSVVRETVKEAIESSMKKDLREVKLLLAKVIKEGYSQPQAIVEKSTGINREEMRKAIRESVGGDFAPRSSGASSVVPRMSEDVAMNMSQNGTLPDFDAPIPKINRNSIIYKELQEKIND